MENPASWKPAELVIEDALSDYHYDHDRGAVGASLVHYVADHLRRAGHLNDTDVPEIGWETLWGHRDERRAEHVNRQAQDGSPVGERESK
jgi:hypothetical protein